ncbi:dephospho-CoA kinase [Clostridium sp. YIM B02515]|uniref:Dephospho-CoA kinase n=1 Tax=Clostridium rhizosphaerae TaxID=2803861 RepID=A0ABS1T670_9CLOT|nr:dephospho-CoA kinase [Clostridium rhizosphaerae]MBL4934835.1 dephospho-CoA kinase [Clostridium rhizosphaerae]
MLKVGLTGGIGSGKSTVSRLFQEKGFPIIDADMISREIYNIYPDVNKEIRKQFGSIFFDTDGLLIRKELGAFIFKDKERVKKIESITLPYILKEIFERLEQLNREDNVLCIIDAPTLIEVGLHRHMDTNILVWVDLNTQIERVKLRDNAKEEDIINRIKAQLPIDEKKKYVDFIIDNRCSLKHTKEQFEVILNSLLLMR